MSKKTSKKRPTQRSRARYRSRTQGGEQKTPRASVSRGKPATEESLEPLPRESTAILSDRERQEAEREARNSVTSAALSGGDVAADWKRTASVGEEAAGGGVAIPDQSDVDDLGSALGVPRAPDEELRTSQEILEGRDRDRWDQES